MKEKQDGKRDKRQLWRLYSLLPIGVLTGVLTAAAVICGNRAQCTKVPAPAQSTVQTVSCDIPAETTVSTPEVPEQTEAVSQDFWAEQRDSEQEKDNINLMLIGQNQNLADTMILCSLDLENHTLSMISFLRDLYLRIPSYEGHPADRNRINTCYYWGSKWKHCPEGGMELLSSCIEENFGILIDHSAAVDFAIFSRIIDLLSGVELELTEKEAAYLSKSVGYVGDFQPGKQVLDGTEALAYARIRKIDSDMQRTDRQRKVIAAMLGKCRELSPRKLYDLAQEVLPMVETDMGYQEIAGYLLRILPHIKELQIRTQTCPVDNQTLPGSYWDKTVKIGGTNCAVIVCDVDKNREYLKSFLNGDL